MLTIVDLGKKHIILQVFPWILKVFKNINSGERKKSLLVEMSIAWVLIYLQAR